MATWARLQPFLNDRRLETNIPERGTLILTAEHMAGGAMEQKTTLDLVVSQQAAGFLRHCQDQQIYGDE